LVATQCLSNVQVKANFYLNETPIENDVCHVTPF
jgi:hypothetical protein